MENKVKSKTKRERFISIVEGRVNKILDAFDSLGKCSNKKNYEYDLEDVKKIFNEIDKKSREVRGFFQEKDSRKKRFTLE